MKKRRGWILVCFASLAVFAHSADPAVTNVRAAQRPGTGLVDITYDLADVDTGMLSVSLSVSTNGGFTYFSPTSTVSGDVQGVACGTDRTMVWNAAVELSPKLYANMRARVRVADIEAPPMPLPLDMPLPPCWTISSLTSPAEWMPRTTQSPIIHRWQICPAASATIGTRRPIC
ncbi:MAG: hypothetical protein WCU90_05160 [Kiritimatiellia bacterium]|jgi:hypothetical protein